MRNPPLPNTGPILVDCRESSAATAMRRVDEVFRRMRPGPRVIVVRFESAEVLEKLTTWADTGGARWERLGGELRFYFLPAQFGGHPAAAFQARYNDAVAAASTTSADALEADAR